MLKMVAGILCLLLIAAGSTVGQWISPRIASQKPIPMIFEYPSSWGSNIQAAGGDGYEIEIIRGMARILWRSLDANDPARAFLGEKPVIITALPSLTRPLNASMTSTGLIVTLVGDSLWSGLIDAATVAHFGKESASLVQMLDYRSNLIEQLLPEAEDGYAGSFLSQHQLGIENLVKVQADGERQHKLVLLRRSLPSADAQAFRDRIERMLRRLNPPTEDEIAILQGDLKNSPVADRVKIPAIPRV